MRTRWTLKQIAATAGLGIGTAHRSITGQNISRAARERIEAALLRLDALAERGAVRKRHPLSLQELAAATGYSTATVHRALRGKGAKPETACRIRAYYEETAAAMPAPGRRKRVRQGRTNTPGEGRPPHET